MATITKFKINGLEQTPPKEWQDLEISATFDNDSVQANINFSALSFVNKANKAIEEWRDGLIGMTEGIPLEIEVSGENNTVVPFNGYLDWDNYNIKSSVESEMGLIKSNGLNSFHERAQGITMQLLESNGTMPTSLGVNVPYLTKNRQSNLEKIQLLTTAYSIVKTGVDEVFKIIAIASDVTTLGAAQAFINLGITLLNLVLLINQIIDQLLEIQKAFFPLVRYRRGIKLKTFLEKGCEYMGYTLDTDNFGEELDKIVLLAHQSGDSEGLPVGFMNLGTDFFLNSTSGILKPSDFGYILSDAFELINKIAYTKVAVIGDTIKLLPYNDSFWTENPTYIMPDVLIEQTKSYQNGLQGFNKVDLKGRTLIEYATDDSDYWTISNVNNSVSETIVTPIQVDTQINVQVKGVDDVQIPYALCIRNEALDELYTLFEDITGLSEEWVTTIKTNFESVTELLESVLPDIGEYLLPITLREGALKVENHFFSTPKIIYMENGKIPSDFTDKIGAIALYNKYHSYKSFVQGIKNPSNLNDTNQKKIFTSVKIPFGIESFNQIINNSYFTDNSGNIGKFTNINWNVSRDFAIVDYYVFENYMNNLQETTI